jgi:hypothetical protein
MTHVSARVKNKVVIRNSRQIVVIEMDADCTSIRQESINMQGS